MLQPRFAWRGLASQALHPAASRPPGPEPDPGWGWRSPAGPGGSQPGPSLSSATHLLRAMGELLATLCLSVVVGCRWVPCWNPLLQLSQGLTTIVLDALGTQVLKECQLRRLEGWGRGSGTAAWHKSHTLPEPVSLSAKRA